MNALKIGMAVLVGFVLGAYLAHPVTAKASSNGSTIYLRRVTEGTYTDPNFANREIVGFSCSNGECYVAVR